MLDGDNNPMASIAGNAFGQFGVGNFNTFRVSGRPIEDRQDKGANGHGTNGYLRFGSAHPGNVNIVLADGSTHSIDNQLDEEQLAELITIDTGGVVDVNNL